MLLDTLNGSLQKFVIHSRLTHGNFFFCGDGCLCEAAYTLAVFYDIVNTQLQVFQPERFRDIVVSTHSQCFLLVFCLCLGCQKNDGQVAELFVMLDGLGEFVAIHSGHHHI